MIDLNTPEGRKAFYNSHEWGQIRRYKLYKEPFCQDCIRLKGELNPGVDVHHIKDIANDPSWENATDINNLVVLCKRCHARITRKSMETKVKEIIEYKPLLKWKSSK